METSSQVSKSSGRSSRSSASAAATKARAKAEAARVQVSYAAKEAAMMREKAHLEAEHQKTYAETARRKAEVEASLYVLQKERCATAASAEAAVYEAAVEVEERPLGDLTQIAHEDPAQRTSEYVQTHSLAPHAQQQAPVSQQPPVKPTQTETPQQNTAQSGPPARAENVLSKLYIKDELVNDMQRADEPVDDARRAYYPCYSPPPMSHTPSLRGYACEIPQMTDLAKYLVRREIVSSGLLKFDDRPENYWAWKTSFQAVARELNLIAREELDLLTKWLGPESSLQALRIRSVHVHNPTAGVNMIWQRLENSYGCPEMIEHALLQKLDNFPRISNKDGQRLRELGDILLEVESAKAGGHLPGLAYLDTARGVNPIVEKLPYGLQERWISQGSKYKDEHHVSFPPFRFFVKFICSQVSCFPHPAA